MEPGRRQTRKSQIAHDILAYLEEHPEAQDTVEGIAEWWLLEQQIKQKNAKVQEAIAELVAKGLILGCKGEGGRILYRINRLKYREIQSLLKDRAQRLH